MMPDVIDMKNDDGSSVTDALKEENDSIFSSSKSIRPLSPTTFAENMCVLVEEPTKISVNKIIDSVDGSALTGLTNEVLFSSINNNTEELRSICEIEMCPSTLNDSRSSTFTLDYVQDDYKCMAKDDFHNSSYHTKGASDAHVFKRGFLDSDYLLHLNDYILELVDNELKHGIVNCDEGRLQNNKYSAMNHAHDSMTKLKTDDAMKEVFFSNTAPISSSTPESGNSKRKICFALNDPVTFKIEEFQKHNITKVQDMSAKLINKLQNKLKIYKDRNETLLSKMYQSEDANFVRVIDVQEIPSVQTLTSEQIMSSGHDKACDVHESINRYSCQQSTEVSEINRSRFQLITLRQDIFELRNDTSKDLSLLAKDLENTCQTIRTACQTFSVEEDTFSILNNQSRRLLMLENENDLNEKELRWTPSEEEDKSLSISKKNAYLLAENTRLCASIFDVAEALLEDASIQEREEFDESVRLRAPLPLRSLGLTFVSPELTESILGMVQASLNRRQLQVYDLRLRQKSLLDAMNSLNIEIQGEKELSSMLKDQLDHEKRNIDDLYIFGTEHNAKLGALQTQISNLKNEKDMLQQNNIDVEMEYRACKDDLKQQKEVLDKLKFDISTLITKNEELASLNASLTKQNIEKDDLFNSLQKSNNDLRLKNESYAISHDLILKEKHDLLSFNKDELLNVSGQKDIDIETAKSQQATLLEENLELEKKLVALVRSENQHKQSCSSLRVENEKFKIKFQQLQKELDISRVTNEQLISTKNSLEKLVESETLYRKDIEVELTNRLKLISKLEMDLVSRDKEKDYFVHRTNSLLSSLEDVKNELDKSRLENDELNGKFLVVQSQLTCLNDDYNKKCSKLKLLEDDSSKNHIGSLKLKTKCQNLTTQMQRLADEKESLNQQLQVKNQELSDALAKTKVIRSLYDKSIDEQKESNLKNINAEAEVTRMTQLLQQEQDVKISTLKNAHNNELVSLESEINDLHAQIESMRVGHKEELHLMHEARQHAVDMFQSALFNKEKEVLRLNDDLEVVLDDLKKLRLDWSERNNLDRSRIHESNLELCNVKIQHAEAQATLSAQIKLLEDNLNAEKSIRSEIEEELSRAKQSLESSYNQMDDISADMATYKIKSTDAVQTMSDLISEKEEVKNMLSKCNDAVDSLTVNKSELENLLNEQRKMNSVLLDNNNSLKSELIRAQQALKAENSAKICLNDKIEYFENELIQIQSQLEHQIAENDTLRSLFVEKEGLTDSTLEEYKKQCEKVSDLERQRVENLREFSSKSHAFEVKINEANLEVAKGRAELEDALKKLNILEGERNCLDSKLVEFSSTIRSQRQSLKSLEANVDQTKIQLEKSLQQENFLRTSFIAVVQLVLRYEDHEDAVVDNCSLSNFNLDIVINERCVEQILELMKCVFERSMDLQRELDETLSRLHKEIKDKEEIRLSHKTISEAKDETNHFLTGCQEQMKNLENKISLADIALANKEEKLRLTTLELKELKSRLHEQQLTTASAEQQTQGTEKRLMNARSSLQSSLTQAEDRLQKLEMHRRSCETEIKRLEGVVMDKTEECDTLRRTVKSNATELNDYKKQCDLSALLDNQRSTKHNTVQQECMLGSGYTETNTRCNEDEVDVSNVQQNIFVDLGTLSKNSSPQNQETVSDKAKGSLNNLSKDCILVELSRLRRDNEGLECRLQELLSASSSNQMDCSVPYRTKLRQMEIENERYRSKIKEVKQLLRIQSTQNYQSLKIAQQEWQEERRRLKMSQNEAVKKAEQIASERMSLLQHRINSLEEKERLNEEENNQRRSRHLLQGLNNESNCFFSSASNLRRELSQSLQNVASAQGAELSYNLLDREAKRLANSRRMFSPEIRLKDNLLLIPPNLFPFKFRRGM